jgi:hypothetical protein
MNEGLNIITRNQATHITGFPPLNHVQDFATFLRIVSQLPHKRGGLKIEAATTEKTILMNTNDS